MKTLALAAALAVPLSAGATSTPWNEACEITDPQIRKLIDAEVFMIPTALISAPRNGTYAIPILQFTTDFPGTPLTASSPFYGQTRAKQGRSGVLIGPDLVLTAPHGPQGTQPGQFDGTSFTVIRGLASVRDASGKCVQPDFAHIPAENLYRVVESVANTYSVGPVAGAYDYAALRLERAVPNATYLRIRRSGAPRSGDRAVSISHPMALSAKVDPEVTLYGLGPNHETLLNGHHALVGSSGGMIFNLDQNEVEAVVAHSAGCVEFVGNEQQVAMVNACPATPVVENRTLADVAEPIPAYTLVATPLDTVVHVAAVGGTPTLASTNYSLRAPSGAPAPIDWSLNVIRPPADGGPTLSLDSKVPSGTLAPGSSRNFAAIAGSGSQCGVFEREFTIGDLTNGNVDRVVHRFEVGITDFAVTPPEGVREARVVGPFAAHTYHLSNPRPTPVTIRIDAPSWVSLSVGRPPAPAAPVASGSLIALGAVGSATASADVNLTASSALPVGTSSGALTFTNTEVSKRCSLTASVDRAIQLTLGTEVFESPEVEEVIAPDSSGFGPTVTGTLEVTENFTVDSVAVDTRLYDARTGGWDAAIGFSRTRYTLIAPDGTRLPLWDSNGIPSGPYYSANQMYLGNPVGVLHIDDATAPSPLGTRLSVLAGRNSRGLWRLEAGPSPGAFELFINFSLKFSGHPTVAAAGEVAVDRSGH